MLNDLLAQHARTIFHHALSLANPLPLVRATISQELVPTPSIYSIAIGKAAISMALGLDEGKSLEAWMGAGVTGPWALPAAILGFAALAFLGVPQFVLIGQL